MHIKRQAVKLYLEGLGFRSIGRFLNVSHLVAYNWIRGFGKKLEKLRIDDEVEVVEMDEMHTYIGLTKRLLDMECCRSDWAKVHRVHARFKGHGHGKRPLGKNRGTRQAATS